MISIKLLCNFIEIALRRGYIPVDLLHIFRAPFPKNIFGWLLLNSTLTLYADQESRHDLTLYLLKQYSIQEVDKLDLIIVL